MSDTVTIPSEIFQRMHKMHVEIEREMERLQYPDTKRDAIWNGYEGRHSDLLTWLKREPTPVESKRRFEFEGPFHIYDFVEHCYWVRESQKEIWQEKA